MSQFLAIIPKAPRERIDVSDLERRRQALVARIVASYAPLLGMDERREPAVVMAGGGGTATVLHYGRVGGPGPQAPAGDTWTLTVGQATSAELGRSLERVGGLLLYRRPVWGRYAVVHVERWMDRATFWATAPGFEGIHWAEDEEHVLISNRPLLAALALARGSREAVRLSEDFTSEYLAAGYSLSGRTPFQGVSTVPVGRALAVSQGRASIEDMPPGMHADLGREHTLGEAVEAMTAALQGAAVRAVAQLDGRPLTLRLSGGKDSRLLLGLFRRYDVDLTAVTFGKPADIDVRLARRLAGMVGVRHVVTTPTLAAGEDDSARIVRTLRDSFGQPPSEAHTARYRGADVDEAGRAICLGQWPLFKGGMARVMRNSLVETQARLHGAVSPLVSRDLASSVHDVIDEWIASTPANSQLERQYLFARAFRSGPYLHSHIALYGRDAMLAYPFGDHQVAAVSDALTMSESVSERVFFGAMRRVWPEVMSVPLDKSVWRFEIDGPVKGISGDDYAQRYTPMPEPTVAERAESTGTAEHSRDSVADLVRGLDADGRLEWALPLVTPAVGASLKAAATGGALETPEGVTPRELTKFVWRLRTADLWRSREWLTAD